MGRDAAIALREPAGESEAAAIISGNDASGLKRGEVRRSLRREADAGFELPSPIHDSLKCIFDSALLPRWHT
jgi:hypothetical protein